MTAPAVDADANGILDQVTDVLGELPELPELLDLDLVDPTEPLQQMIALARLSEELGFSHIWVGDSHLIWREAYVNMTAVALNTIKVRIGTGVTNPLTRQRYNTVRRLPHIRVPTLVIWGENDQVNTWSEVGKPTADGIPGAQAIVYEGIGHAVPWEAPERFARDVLEFLRI